MSLVHIMYKYIIEEVILECYDGTIRPLYTRTPGSAIVQMVMAIAKKIGVDTTRESDLNIPMGHEYFHDHAVLKSLEQSQLLNV